MAHPPWTLTPPNLGTELRFIRGHDYLYEISRRWRAEKTSTKTHGQTLKEKLLRQKNLYCRRQRK